MRTIRSRNLSVPQREPAIERRVSSTGPGLLTGRCRTGAGRGTGTGAGGGSAAFLILAVCSNSSALDFCRHSRSSRCAAVAGNRPGYSGILMSSSAGMRNSLVQSELSGTRRSALPHPTQYSG
jgi:hypothetical protein